MQRSGWAICLYDAALPDEVGLEKMPTESEILQLILSIRLKHVRADSQIRPREFFT
jgi:hypothetical protein